MSIELRHIHKTFGKHQALKDVSLEIRHGELMALLGPSGSGKTTLLRIIAGLDLPDPGAETSILFDGVAVSPQQPAQRQVGFVFQHYALFRTMTVFENIAFGLRVRPKGTRPSDAEVNQRVCRLLELIQLDNMAHRYPSQLSGGQRQRVALARALAIEPKILLLDEPFGALDAKVRQGLRRWLRDLHKEIQVTSVLVTHDQEEALEVADRVVVMNQSRIEQVGTPDEVFHHPCSPFVMDFLGHVNIFRGRRDGNGVLVRPHDLELHVPGPMIDGVDAKVQRIQTAGALVKVQVETDSAESLTVELTHQRYSELGFQTGDAVLVTMRESSVFIEDYSI